MDNTDPYYTRLGLAVYNSHGFESWPQENVKLLFSEEEFSVK